MSDNKNSMGVFLNGKAQIIEMLEIMSATERQKLLNNIRLRNPKLANELMEKSLNFTDLDRLEDFDLKKIISETNPQIMGTALKSAPVNFQRRVLGLCERQYAIETYDIMIKRIENEKRDSQRAQGRILGAFANLVRRQVINL